MIGFDRAAKKHFFILNGVKRVAQTSYIITVINTNCLVKNISTGIEERLPSRHPRMQTARAADVVRARGEDTFSGLLVDCVCSQLRVANRRLDLLVVMVAHMVILQWGTHLDKELGTETQNSI
jgi:hypothetical protein